MKLYQRLLASCGIIILLVITIAVIKICCPYFNATITGMTTATGTLELCVNKPPITDFSNCNTKATLNKVYICDVDVDDTDNVTFSDNTTLFDINNITGVFTFTPTAIGTYSFDITTNDRSNCSNNQFVGTFNLSVQEEEVIQPVEEDERDYRSDSSRSRSSDGITRDIDMMSEISVLIRGENRTHVVLRFTNNGTASLRDVSFDTYSVNGIDVTIEPNYFSEIQSQEEIELTLFFGSEVLEGNYDIFIFVEAEDEFNRHFMINVDLEKGTAVLLEMKEFFDDELIGNLEFEYTLYDWIIVLMISTLLFLVIIKFIFI